MWKSLSEFIVPLITYIYDKKINKVGTSDDGNQKLNFYKLVKLSDKIQKNKFAKYNNICKNRSLCTKCLPNDYLHII